MNHKSFRFGQWRVNPATNTLSCGDLSRQLEPRAMDVLLHLCKHPHVVVSAETLLDACWGDISPSDNAVHKIITQLRRALDDSAVEPRYIETIRKRGYRLLAELSYDDDVSNGSWLHASPFRGLEAFEEQHAAIFFGRKLGVDQLVQVVVSQVQAACAMVLVLGPSGAGKTSLVQAGLIPALKAGAAPAESGLAIASHLQLDCADMGQAGLLDTLASVLLDAELDGQLLFENTSAVSLAQRLAQDLPGLIAQLQTRMPAIRLMLFIDRFEAIFRLPHIGEQERAVFIHVLDQLARSGCILLVLACRNDFYPHLTAYPALMSMKLRGGHFDLAPPGAADIAQIIRHPVQVAQLRYTVDAAGESLDQVLIDAAKAGPDTLPLLQYCLQELYRLRSPDGELSHASFHALGGLEGAIGARAEQVISALGGAQIAALPHVLSQLVLVAEDESTVTSRRVPWSALRNEADHGLVQALVDAHLFVSDLHGGAPAFGIAHEALLRRWPRVVAWIEEHRQALQVRSRISAQAKRWQDSGRKPDMLLPSGTQANQARQLLKTSDFSFTQQEQAFVHASLQGVRRGERLRLTITIVMAGLALLAGGLFLMARSAQQAAEQHRTEAEELMGYMLGDFVDKLRPLGKLDLLDSVSSRALKYLSVPARTTDSDIALAQRAKSLQLISEVRIARSDPAGANNALLAGRDILQRQLQTDPTDIALLKSAGENAFWLGQIHFDQREWNKSQQYFDEYLKYANRQSAASPDDVSGWVEQSYAHNSLGTLALQRSDARRAVAEFALSVDLKTRAYAKTPKDKQLAADLADSLSWQATAQMQFGQLAQAQSLYARALALLQSLHTTYPDETLWINQLAGVWSRQSELKQAGGDNAGSHHDAEQAFSLLQTMIEKDPSNRNWQRKMYIAELRLIDTNREQKLDQSFAHLEKLGQVFAELSRQEPKTLNRQVTLAIVQQKKAAILMQLHQPTAAADTLQPAVEKLKQLSATAPADITIRAAVVDALLLNTDLDVMRNKSNALDHCETVRTLLRPLINGSADFQLLAPWVKAHACLNESDQVSRIKQQLEAMSYRDASYLHYISTHPPKKVTS
ncbi:transcriptional regulator [Janthinobacterium sp. HH01]|uniref:nSTAND1 domain-containing NTPase n=1 Tax=Janthinobacterium sp. HH01 TaxID=1198452 RepID=UPI0002AEA223|nr:winged helix-turn-helix domain-containing protein [Janthinobacterium sp. HH01]ELX08096.1 transcriptional regulator [Janthinobacterium sp. HH01]